MKRRIINEALTSPGRVLDPFIDASSISKESRSLLFPLRMRMLQWRSNRLSKQCVRAPLCLRAHFASLSALQTSRRVTPLCVLMMSCTPCWCRRSPR
jgi:hypothetical protein